MTRASLLLLLPLSLLSGLWLGCEDGLRCGEGTVRTGDRCAPDHDTICAAGTLMMDGVCVPESELSCGAGTRMLGGECVPDGSLACGEGTVEMEGICVPDEPLLRCGLGTRMVDGECVASTEEWVSLPFPEGATVRFSQSMRGFFSHNDRSMFATDFPATEGSMVAAARRGIVVASREDSDSGCGDVSCASQANYIVIDHGDGTLGRYWHLQRNGSDVSPGQVVCAGEVIGRSGNTGFSSGPHLHLGISDLFGFTVPTLFEELRDISDGVPFSQSERVSENAPPASCDRLMEPSACPSGLFLHMGVRLSSEIPCTLADKDRVYPLRGVALGGDGWARISRYDEVTSDWVNECVRTAADGSFTYDLSWPSAEYSGSSSYMMISAGIDSGTAEGGCASLMGWADSPRVFFR